MRKEEDFPRNASRSGGQNRAGQAGTNADAAERAREDLLRRVPPHSVEAEQAVLSGVFLRPDLLHEIIDQVSDADFYLPAHRMIFAAFKALYAKGVSVDQVTVFDWLRDHDQLEAVGGAVYLAELSRAVVSGANAAHWAKIVRDKSMQRALIDASAEIIGNCYDAAKDVALLLDESEKPSFRSPNGQTARHSPAARNWSRRSLTTSPPVTTTRG